MKSHDHTLLHIWISFIFELVFPIIFLAGLNRLFIAFFQKKIVDIT